MRQGKLAVICYKVICYKDCGKRAGREGTIDEMRCLSGISLGGCRRGAQKDEILRVKLEMGIRHEAIGLIVGRGKCQMKGWIHRHR